MHLALATTERGRHSADGTLRARTEWHRVVLPESLADAPEPGVRKGALVYGKGGCTRTVGSRAAHRPPTAASALSAGNCWQATPRPRAAPAAETTMTRPLTKQLAVCY